MESLDQGEVSSHCPSLKFQEGSFSLPELLDSHLLPVVAQHDSSRQPVPFNDFNFDLSQPLLLYKKRNIQKVAARSLCIQDEKYKEVGESLLIPEDYKGWFAVLQRLTGGISRADDTVPHFTSVEELATSNTERFLIGGTKKISGLQLLDRSSAQLKHEQRHFLPGDILTSEKIYYGETRKRTRLFRKPKYITEKFLMCRDEADREVLLPFEQTGIFYQISHKSGKAVKNVLQMSDIVARKLTPRIVKLVFGRFPVTPCSFTGLMKAESSRIETSIIASTIINTKNILLELPVTSGIYFRVAVMDDNLRQNPCYQSAMSLCAERAITYMRNIKVCYNFTTEGDDDMGKHQHLPLFQNNSSPLSRGSSVESEFGQSFRRHRDHLKSDSDKDDHANLRRGCSVDVPDDISIRPARSVSTGRMSFCLGNNYLTVPAFEPGFGMKRNSGNNNTLQEVTTYTTRRGSRISFNGTFFEEEIEEDADNKSPGTPVSGIPPPLATTNIGSYLNILPLPTFSISTEFGEAPMSNTKPPEMSPPPLPRSTSTSGVSSGSTSSVNEGTVSNRGSTESFEYAVPKIDDVQSILTNIKEGSKQSAETALREASSKVRRPSTFQFSEGCFVLPTTKSKLTSCEAIRDEDETKSDDGSPIYENIKSLMELVATLEESTDDELDVRPTHPGENITDNVLCSSNDREACELIDAVYTDANDKHDLERTSEDSSTSDTVDHGLRYKTINQACGECTNELTEQKHDINETKDEGRNRMEYENAVNGLSHTVVDKICLSNSGDQSEHYFKQDVNEDTEHNEKRPKADEFQHSVESAPCDAQNTCSEESDDRDLQTNVRCQCFVDNCIEMSRATSEIKQQPVTYYEENTLKSEDQAIRENVALSACEATNDVDKDDASSIDESSNVRPSDISNRWRQAVKRMLSDEEHDIKPPHITHRRDIEPSEKSLECFSVDEIAEQLRSIGIKDSSVNQLQMQGITGLSFQKILDGDMCLRDCLTGINLIDQQKISMFIRGWRPGNE